MIDINGYFACLLAANENIKFILGFCRSVAFPHLEPHFDHSHQSLYFPALRLFNLNQSVQNDPWCSFSFWLGILYRVTLII